MYYVYDEELDGDGGKLLTVVDFSPRAEDAESVLCRP